MEERIGHFIINYLWPGTQVLMVFTMFVLFIAWRIHAIEQKDTVRLKKVFNTEDGLICCTTDTRVDKHRTEVINSLIEQGWEAVADE